MVVMSRFSPFMTRQSCLAAIATLCSINILTSYNERNEYLLYVWIGCESMEVRRLYVAFEFCFFSTIICDLLFLNDLGSVFSFFFTSLHCRKIELMPYLMLVPLFLQPRVNL